jgi:hypothetical protein
MARSLTVFAVAGLVALAASLLGCGEPGDVNGRAGGARSTTTAATQPQTRRADAGIAYKVSGMKKTVSGAT